MSTKHLLRIYHRLTLGDRTILALLVICFLYPLTLPNCYNFGYNEIDLNSQVKCNFLNDSFLSENSLSKGKSESIGKIPAQFDHIGLIDTGGRYLNPNCNTSQHVAIIIPYRNRSEHLQLFLRHIHTFLMKQNAINYQVFVIEQDDQSPFNRGNLLNIGFHESLNLYPNLNCFVFHDVDILPSDLRQFYTCSEIPRHLCSYLDKFRYVLIYPNLFGGVISIKKEQFIQANGYSNLYSGWGGEDDDFFQRIKHHFGYIERYRKDIGRCVMLTHHQYEVINESRSQLLRDVIARSTVDGLSNINKTYVRKQIEISHLYVKIKVTLN